MKILENIRMILCGIEIFYLIKYLRLFFNKKNSLRRESWLVHIFNIYKHGNYNNTSRDNLHYKIKLM